LTTQKCLCGPHVSQGRGPGAQRTSKYSPHCGNVWQKQYARLHSATLASERSTQRFAVVDLYRNGLGDRLTAAVTVFYFALFTGAHSIIACTTNSIDALEVCYYASTKIRRTPVACMACEGMPLTECIYTSTNTEYFIPETQATH